MVMALLPDHFEIRVAELHPAGFQLIFGVVLNSA
jgi:hypothetical protein